MEGIKRKLLVIRHGERCDFTFNQQGVNWLKQAFDSNGKYHQFDLNLPRNLPKRKDGYEKFAYDSPLTEMGYLQSKLTGRALRDHGLKIDHIYCSSALRCVQTAVGILKGMDCRTMKINIEPGLFEWTRWCRNGIPSWMLSEELSRLGYPINTSYVPYVKSESLSTVESLVDFYERSYALVHKILNRHTGDGTILLVTHGPSLDALTRQLCGGTPRSLEEFMYNLQQIPYLACFQVFEKNGCSEWEFGGSPIPPLTHVANSSFDPRILSSGPPFIINSIEN